MKKSTVWVGIGGLVLGCVIGFGLHPILLKVSQRSQDPIYAWLDGEPLSASQIHQNIQADLDQLEKNQYQLKRKATEDLIRTILKARLEKQGMPATPPPSIPSEELADFFKKRNLNPQKMSRGERENYLRILANERNQNQEAQKIQELRKAAKVRWNLPQPSEKEFHLEANELALRGPRFAPVEIWMVSNLQCPYCSEGEKRLKEIQEKYKDQVRIGYYFSFNEPDNSLVRATAEASYCAQDQGRFWEYHEGLNLQTVTDLAGLSQVAEKIGLKKSEFETCLLQRRKRELVSKDLQKLARAIIPPDVPGLLINGKWRAAHLPLEEISMLIDNEIQR